MFLYENEICPVCEKPFQEGDDVVTCPDCGTPHHRECYDKLGRCENQNLHGTGFVYKRTDTQETKQHESFEAPEINSREEYYIPPEAESTGDEAKTAEISVRELPISRRAVSIAFKEPPASIRKARSPALIKVQFPREPEKRLATPSSSRLMGALSPCSG